MFCITLKMYRITEICLLFTMLTLGYCSLLGPEDLPKPFLSTKCGFQTRSKILPYKTSQGQISRVSDAKFIPDSDKAMVCKIKDLRANHVGYVEITIVPTKWENPSMITFVTNENLAAKLRDAIIECPVADRNSPNPSEHDSVQEYACNRIVGLKIHFVKGKDRIRGKRSASGRTKRKGRSLKLGHPCQMKNYKEGLYLYNASGKRDCILCETDYFVDTRSYSCTPCPANTSRAGPHGFTTCVYDKPEMNMNIDEKEESTVTPFASKTQAMQPVSSSPSPRSTVEIVPESNTKKTFSQILMMNCTPTYLRIENKTSTTAIAKWCPLFCAIFYNVSSLKIVVFECLREKETKKSYNVSLSATHHQCHELKPNTTYCLAMQALTLNGAMPVSKTLRFHTNPGTRAPSDIKMTPSGSEVEVEWQRLEDEKLLNVMINYKNLDCPSMRLGSIQFEKGRSQRIKFHLPNDGRYKLSMHYFDDRQHHGPDSDWHHVDIKRERTYDCEGWSNELAIATVLICSFAALVLGLILGYWRHASIKALLNKSFQGLSCCWPAEPTQHPPEELRPLEKGEANCANHQM